VSTTPETPDTVEDTSPVAASADIVASIVKAAEALNEFDDKATYAVIRDAIREEVGDFAKARIVKAVAKSRMLTTAKVEKLWGKLAPEIAAAAVIPSTPEELAAQAAVVVEAQAKAREEAAARANAERAAIWEKCKDLAEDPHLVSRFGDIVRRSGVVGEGAAIVATKLVVVSRLLSEPASLLRKGASASGKNTVLEKVLKFSREGRDYLSMSAASAKSLVYMDEPFSNKLLYVAEAAGIATKANGDEDPFAAMLRTILSEGRIVYPVVEQEEDPETGRRRHITRTIICDGPIGLLMTTARENVEEELATRLLVSHSDESTSQTKRVLAALAQQAMGTGNYPTIGEIDAWLALEDWLHSGPREVVVPFAGRVADLASKASVRMRRDFRALMSLVKASALLHQAQRRKDTNGRVIAQMEDYHIALFGIGEGVAAAQGGKEVDTHAIAVAVWKLVRRDQRAVIRSEVAQTVAKTLAADPAFARAAASLRQLGAKARDIRDIRKVVDKHGLQIPLSLQRQRVSAARAQVNARLKANNLVLPTNKRASTRELAAVLGITQKVARTRLTKALEDAVVVDSGAAHGNTGRPGQAFVLAVGPTFDIHATPQRKGEVVFPTAEEVGS
jgi:hypothetical protein